MPTHERFAKIVLWYRYDPVAFALRLKAMQYRPRDGGVCRGDMANRSPIQRASSSGVRPELLFGPIDVVAFKPPTSDIVAVTDDRPVPLPYFVSPGRNLSIKQGVPTPLSRSLLSRSLCPIAKSIASFNCRVWSGFNRYAIQPTSRACLRKSSSCEPVTNIIGNVKPLDAR